jgi:hypothetical protein
MDAHLWMLSKDLTMRWLAECHESDDFDSVLMTYLAIFELKTCLVVSILEEVKQE